MQLSSPVAYNLQTVEEALRPGAPGFIVYSVSKALADLSVRDFKRAHLDLDLTTIHPSYIYGPVGSGQVHNSPGTGTNRFVYDLIDGAPSRPVNGYDPQAATLGPPPPSVDVRDVARAHVLALKVPPSDTLKRFILSSNMFTWKEAVEFLTQARPELKGHLVAAYPSSRERKLHIRPFLRLIRARRKRSLG